MILTAQVANLSGGAAAGGGARGGAGTTPGAAGGGAGATPLVTFAATPAMVNHQDLINYSMKVGTMIYDKGCEQLTTEFGMKSSGTIVYTTELQAKCVKMRWHMGTQQIINFTTTAGSTIKIVHQYGQIDAATLQAQCEVFCKSTGALFQARARQNNTMMSKCIMKMLTPAARVRLFPFRGDYEIDDVIYAPLLQKKIMALATIDSVTTTKTLCSNLRELPTYCSTIIKGDIKILHYYFDANYTQINAHGATVNDPTNILFSAYLVIPCHNFRSYIKRKQDAYTDGTLALTHEELFMLAANKFNLLKQEGSWGAKSPDKDKIVAMQAEVTALKGQFQLAPNLKKTVGAKDDDKAGGKKKGGGNNKKKKNKKNNAKKREQKKDENRKKTPRKEGSSPERGQGMYLVLVQAPHGMGKPQGRKLPTRQGPHQPTEKRHQPSCSPSRLCNHPQLQVASLDGQYAPQPGRRLTGQTHMETMVDLLVSFHGRGKLKQGTSSPDLPYAPIFLSHPVLVPHQVGGSLP